MQISIGRLFRVLLLVLAIARAAAAQDGITISGAITTRADGLPVPGAVVSVAGAHESATADASGRYTLKAPRSVTRGDRIN